MSTITVVNVKHAAPGSFIYCGRYNSTYKLQGSPLANPFKLSREGCRSTLLTLYRAWLYRHRNDKAIAAEISRLAGLLECGDVALGCWCAPKACHCDVIADFVRREVARRAAVAAMQRKPTQAPQKRKVAGIDGDAVTELGPMFERVEK